MGNQPLTFHLRTFGCKTNQYESQGLREALACSGFEEVDASAAAVCVVNSCSVTGRAERTVRNAINRLRRENSAAKIVLAGCSVDLDAPWLSDLGCDLLLTNDDKADAAARIRQMLGEPATAASAANRFGLSISAFAEHSRAFVKIQDGCNQRCSYCTIPDARGTPVSRNPGEILEECTRLAANGYREIVLTGINLGMYQTGSVSLPQLIGELANTPELLRLRISSIEPQFVTPDLLAVMAAHETICPHLHIPLQSGCDTTLAAMRRPYTVGEYLRILDQARAALDNPAITSDVIVGFPGEDEAAFLTTFATCEQAAFSRLHVFLFSARPGTPAAALKQTETNRAIHERKSRLIELGDAMASRYASGFVGKCVKLLPEWDEDGFPAGYTTRYLHARANTPVENRDALISLQITGQDGATLRGTPIP